MDIPEKLATSHIGYTRHRTKINVRETHLPRGNQEWNSREAGNIGYRRHRTKINIRENPRGNQEWIQATLGTEDNVRENPRGNQE